MEEPRDATAADARAAGFPPLVHPWFLAARMTAVAGALAGILFLTVFGERADVSFLLMGYAYILVPFAVAWGGGSRSASAARQGAFTGLNLLALTVYVSALVEGSWLHRMGYLGLTPLILMSPFQLIGSIIAILVTRRRGSPRP